MPRRSHGHTSDVAQDRRKTPTYTTWASMIQRCTNPKLKLWHRYGGRGIRVCERWQSFANFLEDMGERPPGTTLDRYPDNDGNYEPGNCRWATWREQRLNSSSQIHLLTFNGETMPLKDWARRLGLKRATLSNRILYHGWSLERALTTTTEQGIADKVESGRKRQRNVLGRFQKD